jgi:phosphoribosyl-dephospho-CoA transferase
MYRRHDLVWLSARGWERVLAGSGQASGHAAALAAWQQGGWPATVRRADADGSSDTVALGISVLAAGAGKLRIGFCAALSDVINSTAALALAHLPPELPAAWRTHVPALQADLQGLPVQFYGSASHQAVTGQVYLRDQSDLDLLACPRSPAELNFMLAKFARHGEALPLDGEIVFPSGAAVAWKEWQGAVHDGDRVLVKDARMVRLASRAALLAEFT